jgi:TP901 family phage tail tape measure protein
MPQNQGINIEAVAELTKDIKSLIQELQKLESSLVGTEKRINVIDAAFGGMDNFDQFIKKINELNKFKAKAFEGIAKGLSFIVLNLQDFKDVDIQRFDVLKNNLQNFITALSKININVSKFSQITRLLTQIGQSLESLVNAADRYGSGTRNKIIAMVTDLGAITGVVASGLNRIGNPEAIDKMTKSFDRIGRSLRSVQKLDDIDIDFKFILKIFKTLVSVGIAIRVASKSLGNSNRIKTFSDAISAVSRLFNALKSLQDDNINIEGFKQSLDFIAKAIIDFDSKISKTKNIEKISRTISNLAKIVDSSIQSQLPKLKESARGFNEGFFATLRRGFVEQIGRRAFDTMAGFLRKRIDDLSGGLLRRVSDFSRNLSQQLRASIFGIEDVLRSAAVGSAINFDDLLKQLQVFGGESFATDAQIKQVQRFVNEIGIKYPISANKALEATLDLAKAGQEFADIQNILPNAADLAALSESKDINKATNFLIAAKNTFTEFADGVEASFEPKAIKGVADTIFAAANVSKAGIDDLAAAVAVAGPAARQFGENLEDTAAAIAILNDAEIKGEKAGRDYSSLLNEISKDKARKELSRLGIAFQEQNGDLRSLNDIVKDLNRRYKQLGFSQTEVADSLSNFGDVAAKRTLNILLARDGIDSMKESMQDVGSASEGAQDLLESLRGQLNQLQGSVESLLTRALLPMLDRFFKPFVKLARFVVDSINSLDDRTLETITTFVLLVSTLVTVTAAVASITFVLSQFVVIAGSVIASIGQAVSFLFSFKAIILSVQVSVSVLGATILSIVAILGVIAGSITKFANDIQDNVGGAKELFDKLKDSISEVADVVKRVGSVVFRIFRRIVHAFSNAQDEFLSTNNVLNGLLGTVQKMYSFFKDVLEFFEGFDFFLAGTTNRFGQYIKLLDKLSENNFVQALFGKDVTPAQIDKAFRDIANGIRAITRVIGDISGGVFDIITGDVEGAKRKFKDAFTTIFDSINKLINNVTGIDLSRLFNFSKISEAIDSVFSVFNKLAATIRFVGNSIYRLINSLRLTHDIFLSIKVSFGDFISEFLEFIGIPTQVAQKIEDGFIRVLAILNLAVIRIKEFVGNIADTVLPIISSIFSGIQDAVNSLFSGDGITKEGNTIVSSIISIFSPLGFLLTNLFKGIFKNISFNELLEELFKFIDNVYSGIQNFISLLQSGQSLGSAIEDAFNIVGATDFINGFIDILYALSETVGRVFFEIGAFIVNSGIPAAIKIITSAFDAMFEVISAVLPAISELIRFFVEEGAPAFIDTFTNILATLSDVVSFITDTFAQAFSSIAGLISGVISAAIPVITRIFEKAVLFLESFSQFVESAWRGVEPVLRAIADIIFDVLIPVFENFVSNILLPLAEMFITTFINIGRAVLPVLGTIIEIIGTVLGPVISTLGRAIGDVANFIIKVLGGLYQIISPILFAIQELFVQLAGIINEVYQFLLPVFQGIGRAIELIYNISRIPLLALGKLFDAIFGFIRDEVVPPVTDAINGFIGIVEGIWNALQGPLNSLKDLFFSIFGPIIDLINQAVAGIEAFIGSVTEALTGTQEELQQEVDGVTADIETNVTVEDNASDSIEKSFKEGGENTYEDILSGFADANYDDLGQQFGESASNTLLDNVGDGQILGNDNPFELPSGVVPTEITNPEDIPVAPDVTITGQDLGISLPERDFEAEKDLIKEEERLSKLRETERKELEKENSQREKIQKLEQEARNSERESEQKFRKEQRRAAQDQRDKLLEIDAKGAQNIIDATASRDSAAAINAVKNAKQERQKQESEYNKARQRREQDFAEEQAAAKARNDLRIAEEKARLQEIIAENARNRQLREEEHQRDLRLAEIKKAEEEAANAEQIAASDMRRDNLVSNEQAITEQSTSLAQQKLDEMTQKEADLNYKLGILQEDKYQNTERLENEIKSELVNIGADKKFLLSAVENESKDEVIDTAEKKAQGVAKAEDEITANLEKNVEERNGILGTQVDKTVQGFTDFAAVVNTTKDNFNTEVQNMSNQVATGLNNLARIFTQGVNNIISGLNNVVRAISHSGSVQSNQGSSYSASSSSASSQSQLSYSQELAQILQSNGGGRLSYQTFAANGAENLLPNRRTRVGESNMPELFFQGNNQYLIPGDRGRVVPMEGRYNKGQGGTRIIDNSSVSIPISIKIENAGNMDVDQLTKEVERQIVPKITERISRVNQSRRVKL